jgi:glutamyl-Q tRNA(Asp) synthetase
MARMREGQFILRIEDIDQQRCRPEFEQAILRDLQWLGIEWEGPVLRQSEHLERYKDGLGELQAAGLLYRCFRTRKELSALASAPHGPEGALRPGPLPAAEEDRFLSDGRAFSWRLNMATAMTRMGEVVVYTEESEDGTRHQRRADLTELGDIVLGRKDFPASYHLASALDDARQGITLVYRGEDLRDALPVHRLLQELLGLPAPAYRHHRLILGEDGKRLAKRDKAKTLAALRDSGVSPEGIRRRLDLAPAPAGS